MRMPRRVVGLRRWSALTLAMIAGLAAGADPPADGRTHWAFRPLSHPNPPAVAGPAHTPVDRFLLARLEAAGLTFAAEADRASLIRRVLPELNYQPNPAPHPPQAPQAPAGNGWDSASSRLR